MSNTILRWATIICTFLWLAAMPVLAQYNLAPRFIFTTNNGSLTITNYVSSYITGPGSEVDIPDFTNGYPVTGISSGAFGSGSPTSIIIPASVTNIGEGAFEYCPFLTNISVDAENPNYISKNGLLFNRPMTLLLQYPAGLTADSYEIPTNIARIGAYAFAGCFGLVNVTIPAGVTSIGEGAFFYCESLTNMVIPAGITSIDSNTFMFSGVTSVTIPNSITNIGNLAFELCYNLTSLYFYGDVPIADIYAFSYDGSATAYYLPGKTGWGSTLSGIPTALWLPQVQAVNNSGIFTAAFGFNINWASGQTVVVEACTNLFNPDWQPVQTNMLTTGSTYFNDPQWTNYPNRFYRIRSQ